MRAVWQYETAYFFTKEQLFSEDLCPSLFVEVFNTLDDPKMDQCYALWYIEQIVSGRLAIMWSVQTLTVEPVPRRVEECVAPVQLYFWIRNLPRQ